MKGFFEIDRVPGNFHFACHGYGPIIHRLVNQGYRTFLTIQVCSICHITSTNSDSASRNQSNTEQTVWETSTPRRKSNRSSWELPTPTS
jgi:hypothetical protein